MSLTEFKKPDFLEGVTSQTIMDKMLKELPDDIDKTEGGFVWDMLKPTALEKAEMLQYYFPETLKIMFPMWADGKWLDLHAKNVGLERRPSNSAYGILTITGIAGTKIPKGFVFSVPSDGGEPAIDYYALDDYEIGDSGEIDIEVQASESGRGSNVSKEKVTIMRTPISGITRITNAEPITGGTPAEDDESLRKRIDDLLAGRGNSFVGNNRDYVRWAQEVAGVGLARTVPEYMGPNSVKVIVVDGNGEPANQMILDNVREYIWGKNRYDENRLAPIGVINFEVVAPHVVTVDFSFKLKLDTDYTMEEVIESFRTNLMNYYAQISQITKGDVELKYYKLASILTETQGVNDIDDFLVNGKEENLFFGITEYPRTGKLEVELYG